MAKESARNTTLHEAEATLAANLLLDGIRDRLKEGYIVMEDCTEQGGERYNIYYDSETQRAPIFEKNLVKDGFKILQFHG